MEAVAEAQELFRPDAGGAELVEAMRPLAEHCHVIDNQKLSGLAGNDLPGLLAEQGVDTVFLTGVATNLTVEQTARHGTDLGLAVYVVSDCVAAVSDEVHRASLANLALTTRGLITATEAVGVVGAA
jgi:nicotinamidase-related amidase